MPYCSFFAIMLISVETWLRVAMVKNTVFPLTSVVGVLGMVRLPAGKVSLETTRSGPTIVSVMATELLVSMCAELK